MDGDSAGSERSVPIRLVDLNKDLRSIREQPLLKHDRRSSSLQTDTVDAHHTTSVRTTAHLDSTVVRSSTAQVPKAHDNMDETRKRLSALLSKERTIRQQSSSSGSGNRGGVFAAPKIDSPQRTSPTKYQRARSASPTLRRGSASFGIGSADLLQSDYYLHQKGSTDHIFRSTATAARDERAFGVDLRTYKEAYSDEEALMQGLDAEKLEAMNDKIQISLADIDNSEDELGIVGVLDDVHQTLSTVSIGLVQMWLLDSNGSLVAVRADGIRNSISPDKSSELLSEITSSSSVRSNITVTAGHYLWDELYSSLKSNSNSNSTDNVAPAGRADTRDHDANASIQRGWKSVSVYAISPSPTHSPVGLLFAAELFPQTVPLALTKRISYINAARIRALVAKQCLCQCAVAIACRISALGHGDEISGMSKRLHESLSRADAAEGILSAYEELVSAESSAAVAASIAQAGVRSMDATMAWCLLQAPEMESSHSAGGEDNNGNPFIISSSLDTSNRCWVTVHSGHKEHGSSPITLQAHSRSLIASLLKAGGSGDASSSQPSILEVSGADLARTGLAVSSNGNYDFAGTLGSQTQPSSDAIYTLIAVPVATSKHGSDVDGEGVGGSSRCTLVLAFSNINNNRNSSEGGGGGLGLGFDHFRGTGTKGASDIFAESMSSQQQFLQFRESAARRSGRCFFGTRGGGGGGRNKQQEHYWKDRAIAQSVMLAAMASRAFLRLEAACERDSTQLLKSIPGQLFDIVGKDEWLGAGGASGAGGGRGDNDKHTKPFFKVPAEADEFQEERDRFNESYVGGRDAEEEGLADKFRRCALEGGFIKGCFLNIAGAMQSEAFARCFGARRGVLLLSTSFASSVGLVKGFNTADATAEKLDPRSTYFLQVLPSGLKRVTNSPITISCDWMKDLLAGRGVGVSSLSPAAAASSARNNAAAAAAGGGRGAFSSSFRSRNRLSGVGGLAAAGGGGAGASSAARGGKGGAFGVTFEDDHDDDYDHISSYMESLNELVVNADPKARSALLLPIRTDGGLCVLLLLDKVVDAGYAPGGIQAFHGFEDEDNMAAFSKLSSFSIPDAETIISTGICSDMAAALDAARKVHTAQKANSERERLRKQLTQIAEVLKVQREKYIAAKCLSLWRRSAARKGSKLLNTTAGRILHATLEMLKFGLPEKRLKSSSSPVSNSFMAFLQCVERQVARAFPGDIVTMIPGDGLSGESSGKGSRRGGFTGTSSAGGGGSDDHITVVNSYAQGSSVPFVATSAFSSLEGRSFDEPKDRLVLVGIIRQSNTAPSSGPFRSTGSQKSSSEQLDDSLRARVLGSVRVSRNQGTAHPFTQEDMQLLGHICDVATVVITALQKGVNPSAAVDGDVRSLLLPLLNRAVPCLLETVSKGNTDIRSMLSQLALIIKRLSGGDVALLRVTTPGDQSEIHTSAGGVFSDISRGLGLGLGGASSSSSSSSAGRSSSGGREIVVSSEDGLTNSSTSPFLDSPLSGNNDTDAINDRRASALRDMLVRDRSVTVRIADPSGDGEATFVADQIVLKLLRDSGFASDSSSSGGGGVLGELKVVGAHAQTFDSDQCSAVQLLAYILAHSVSTAQKMRDLEQEVETTLVVNRQLEAAIKDSARGIASQKGSGDVLKLRFNCALSLASFAAAVPEISSIQALANYVGESLPQILRVDAAVFLALEEDRDRSSSAAADIRASSEPFFRPRLPRHDSAARVPHIDTSSLSLTQLSRIPSYGDDPRAMQSKILLLRKDTGLAFGAILLYRRKRDTHSDAELSTWTTDNAGDVMMGNITSAIACCLSKIEVADSMATVQRALDTTESLRKERDGLKKELVTVTDLKSQADIRCTKAIQDVTVLEEKLKEATNVLNDAEKRAQEAVDEIASRNDNQFDRMKSRMHDLEASLKKAHEDLLAARASKEGLESLIGSFTVDPRCNKETVMQWMDDFVHTKQIQQLTVSQEETGALVGGNGLRGLIPAVGEALRTTQPVEVMSSYSSGSSVLEIGRQSLSLSATSAMEFMSQASSSGGSLNSSDSVAMLCVPNDTLPLGSPTKYEHACFVFIKPAKSKADGFTEAEKAALSGAAKLCGSTLSRTSIRYSQEDYYKFDQVLQRERQLMAMVKQAMISSESTFMRTGVAQGRGEICSSVEGTVISLLSRGERDPCKIASTMWFLPASWSSEGSSQSYTSALAELAAGSSKKDPILQLSPGDISQVYPVLASLGMSADAEILHRVLQTGASQRKGSVMWVPLKSPKGDILAVIRIERKLSSNAEERLYDSYSNDYGGRSAAGGGGLVGSFSQAGINASGGGFLSSLVGTGITQDKRVSAGNPSLSDLFITSDEEELVSIFARLSYPLFDRLRILAESYSSVQQAGEAIAAIQSVKTILEEKLTLEVAYRLELEDALKSGADMLGSTTSQRVATGQLLDSARRAVTSVTSSDDCCIIFPKISDQFRGKGDVPDPRNTPDGENNDVSFSSFDDGELFTLDLDKVNPNHVRLEESDLEAMAMRGLRAIAVPSIPDNLDGSPRPSASSIAAQLGRQVWQSWSVRRAQARGLLDAESPLYALSVPFQLRRGSKGVVTVFRRGAPYTATDRDCIAWVARVLGYCMEMMGDDEAIFEIRQRAVSLEREVAQLREAESRLRQLERHGEELERNMCGTGNKNTTESSPSASDLHHLLQNTASGHIILPSSRAGAVAPPSQGTTTAARLARVRWSASSSSSDPPPSSTPGNNAPHPVAAGGSHNTSGKGSSSSNEDVGQFQQKALAKVQSDWESEAVQVVLSSCQTALGSGSSVELSDPEEAQELLGDLLTSDSTSGDANTNDTSSSRQRQASSFTSSSFSNIKKASVTKQKKDEKGVIQSTVGQIHFWMVHRDVDAASDRPAAASTTTSFGIERAAVVPSTKEAVLIVVAVVQHDGYPPVWMKTTFSIRESLDVAQMRLRFSVLLKLLDCQSTWRNRLLASLKELIQSETKLKTMDAVLQGEQQRFSAELAQVMAVHKSTLEVNKSKYKIAVQLRTRQCKQAEDLFCATATACAVLRKDLDIFSKPSSIASNVKPTTTKSQSVVNSNARAKAVDARCPSTLLWLRTILTQICEKVAAATGGDIVIGVAKAAPPSHSSAGGGNMAASFDVKWLSNPSSVIGVAGAGRVSNPATDCLDPLHIAITQSRIVIIGSGEEEKSLHSSIDFISQVIGGQGPIASVLSPSASYAAGTVIVPVPLTYSNITGSSGSSRSLDADSSVLDAETRPDCVVLVSRMYPPSAESDNGKESSSSSSSASAKSSSSFAALICSVIASWHSFASCIQDTVRTRELILSQQQQGKRVALVSAVRSVQSAWGAEANKSLLFEKMRVALLEKRLGHSEEEVSRLVVLKKRVSTLEQSVADWTEIVRGVNSAAHGVAGGVPGLWMQACRILMTLMSSHITLTSCGLCLANDTGDVFDLSVRELSTPMPFRSRSQPPPTTGKDGTPFAEFPDYARGVLELIPATELGDKVHDLLFELLNQPTGTHTVQRLYKLAPGHSEEDHLASEQVKTPGSGLFTPAHSTGPPGRRSQTTTTPGRSGGRLGNEQVWLVPVRSATSVLAVLRVTVELPRTDFSGTGMTSVLGSARASSRRSRPGPSATPASGVFASGGGGRLGVSFVDEIAEVDDFATRSEMRTPAEDSKQQRIASAQSNLINFAEVFAPLVAAAQQIELVRGTSSEKDDLIRKYVQQQKVTIPELNRSLKKNNLICSALLAVNEVADVMASGLTDFKVDPKSAETQVMVVMAMLADLISSRLTTALSLPVNVQIKDESRKGRKGLHASYSYSRHHQHGTAGNEVEDAVQEALHGDPSMAAELSEAMGLSASVGKRSISHRLIDHTGYEYGTISVSLSPNLFGDDDYRDSDGVANKNAPGTAGTTSKQLFPHLAEMELHTSSVADILPSVAGIVSSVLLCCTREFEAKERFAEAIESVSVLETDLQVHQFRSEELDRTQSESLKSRDYFRGLADIVNDCLYFSAVQLTWPGDKDREDHHSSSANNDWHQHHIPHPPSNYPPAAIASMPHLLRSLAGRIPTLIGRISMVRFATITSTAATSAENTEGVDESKGGEGRRNRSRRSPHTVFDDRHKLRWFTAEHEPFGTTRINLDLEAMGVAENLVRACIFKLSRSSVDMSGVGDGVRVFTYPLLRTSGPTTDVGAEALGVMQVFLTLTESDFRADATASTSANGSTSPVTVSCTQVDNLCDDLARSVACAVSVDQCKFQLRHACLERAELWRSVAAGAAAITKNCVSEIKFPEVLASREVISALRDAGIRITLRWQGAQKGQALGFIDDQAKVSSESGHNTLTVRLDENGEAVAEISCDAHLFSSEERKSLQASPMDGVSSQVAAEAVEIIGTILRATSALHRMKTFEASDMMQRHWATVQQLEKLKVELAAANAKANIASFSGSGGGSGSVYAPAPAQAVQSATKQLTLPDDFIDTTSRSRQTGREPLPVRASSVDTITRYPAQSVVQGSTSAPIILSAPALAPIPSSVIDGRRETERFERLRRHRMSAILGILAPAVSELISVLREFELLDENNIAEGLVGEESGQQAKKARYEYAWEAFARVAGRAIGKLDGAGAGAGASGRKPHVSLVVWDRNEPLVSANSANSQRIGGARSKKTDNNDQDQNNVMRVRMYDTAGNAKDQVRIAFTLPTSVQAGAGSGYGLPAGILANAASFGGSAQFVNAAAIAQSVPVLERTLRLGGIHEIVGTTSPSDLVGIDQRTLAELVALPDTVLSTGDSMMGSQALSVRLSVLCAAVQDVPSGLSAILRVVYPVMPGESDYEISELGSGDSSSSSVSFSRSLLRPAAEMITAIGGALVASSIRQREQNILAASMQSGLEVPPLGVRGPLNRYLSAKETELIVKKFVAMHSSLCSESIAMLEPPRPDIIESSNGPRQQTSPMPRITHPAALTALAASQDTCLKILLMVRNVLKAEGAALLLTDPSTVPVSYQVIYSGDVLSWSGIAYESFGVVSAPSVYGSSLVEHCIKTKRIIATGDVSTDERFGTAVDGNCPSGTSLVIVPLKGRGQSIVGVLMVARKSGSGIFSQEDTVAAELVASYGSIGLYWCQGLGAMHRQLSKYAKKIVQMEKDLTELAPLKIIKKT